MATLKERVEALEREIIAEAIQRHRWNRSRVAIELGLSRVGLANKLHRYGFMMVDGSRCDRQPKPTLEPPPGLLSAL